MSITERSLTELIFRLFRKLISRQSDAERDGDIDWSSFDLATSLYFVE